ncbi:hypothetical protein Thermo_00597 [Thermoplasmatales archaeon]|nr:hypothetical protein Thermo_00597 [Thermoplasmatales archaeon]
MIGSIMVFRFPKKTEQPVVNKFIQKFYGLDSTSWQGKYKFYKTRAWEFSLDDTEKTIGFLENIH